LSGPRPPHLGCAHAGIHAQKPQAQRAAREHIVCIRDHLKEIAQEEQHLMRATMSLEGGS
jgi:hypothetical protein